MSDLMKFSETLHTQQKYLERTKGMPKPNWEMEASTSDILAGVVKLLDEMIAKHLDADVPYYNRLKKYQDKRTYSRGVFYSGW